ncbi:MAG: TetR/AcrR family transcriptional regulator [Acidimicrobiales bacterium]
MGRREQARASRAGLLEAARDCFAEKGYEATTVAGILARAGMARGALYHYFPGGKREIFDEVFAALNDAFHQRRDALTAVPSPLARLRGGMRIFLELCTEDAYARIALVDAPRVIPAQAERGSSYALVREQLAEAVEAGEIQAVDVEATAMALYAAIRGAGEYVTGAADRAAAADVATRTLYLMLHGLRTVERPQGPPKRTPAHQS